MAKYPDHYAELNEMMPSTSPEWKRADSAKREEKRIQDEQETRRIQMKRGMNLS